MHGNLLRRLSGPLRLLHHPLNEHRKLAALRRWVAWKIAALVVPGPVIFEFVNDSMLIVEPRLDAATCNLYTGIYEFRDMSFILHFLRPDDVFVDVGANIGAYTVLAAAVRGASSISIEPVPSAYAHLMRNVHLNGVRPKVQAHNVAVGSKRGSVSFTSGRDSVNHVAIEAEMGDADIIEVEVKTLDEILGSARPTVIKIDVEGYENEIIQGGHTTFGQDSLLAIIMELNGSGRRYAYDEDALHARMLDYGFAPFVYSPLERRLAPLTGKNAIEDNTLYLRRPEVVLQRLRSAPSFRVAGQEI